MATTGSARVVPVPQRSFGKTVTILDTESLSDAEDLGDYTLCGILLPSGWDTNAISFATSTAIDGTYVPIYTAAGAEVATGNVVASTWVALDPADFAGVRFLKLRSGTSAAAVAQSGTVVLTLACRSV